MRPTTTIGRSSHGIQETVTTARPHRRSGDCSSRDEEAGRARAGGRRRTVRGGHAVRAASRRASGGPGGPDRAPREAARVWRADGRRVRGGEGEGARGLTKGGLSKAALPLSSAVELHV